MNLLLNRSQKSVALFSLVPLRVGSGVMFHLHAELEIDDEERNLMIKYRLSGAPLVLSDPIDDLKMALRPAVIVGLVAFLLLWFVVSFSMATSLALLIVLGMTVVYFKTMREMIVVSDLLHGGRIFRCDSIIALIQKEAFLEGISEYLRQVMESAKHWHDRETIPIKPLDKALAKQVVLSSTRG